jgi:hypothetical protein
MPDDGRIPTPTLTLELPASDQRRIEGVVIGTLVAVRDGQPIVQHAELRGLPEQVATAARMLDADDVGAEVAIVFVGGDPSAPLIIGKLEHPSAATTVTRPRQQRELLFEAERQITLRCGQSSITLTREGQIVIRGKHLLSRASSVNRIRGGVIQLN